MRYEIEYLKSTLNETESKVNALAAISPYVDSEIEIINNILLRTRPVVLQMNLSAYNNGTKRPWEPIIQAKETSASPSSYGFISVKDNKEFLESLRIDIYVRSDPSWECWRRWSSVIIDDFYTGMRALTKYYKLPIKDQSVSQTEYKFETLSMRYQYKEPVRRINLPAIKPAISRYSDMVYDVTRVDFYVNISLEFPNPPNDSVQQDGCHMTTETITETKTKTIRRMKCD